MTTLALFQLDNSGKCSSCTKIAPTAEIIKCSTCKEFYHGTCSESDESNFICRVSFLKIWHSPSVKSNFEWHCDNCKTRREQKEVFSVENKLDQLTDMVTKLTSEVSTVKSNFTDELASVKNTIAGIPISTSSTSSVPLPSPAQTVWGNQKKVSQMKSSLVMKSKPGASGFDKSSHLDKIQHVAVENQIPVSR